MNRRPLLLVLPLALAAACGPAPTEEAMMEEEAEPAAMMDEEQEGETMMEGKEEGEAMTAAETPTAMAEKSGEMMAGETSTPEAMMEEKDGESMEGDEQTMMAELPPMLTAPHFVDSFPAHEQKLPEAPAELVINFNFTLHPDSEVSVRRDGQPVEVGPQALSEDKLSLRAPLQAEGDGVYTVDYRACWPDASCHEGSFSFVVRAEERSRYLDLRGQAEVTVHMSQIRFEPGGILISPGTRVTWINDDPVAHFVNSDPHPSHNVHPALNSLELERGDSYGFVFEAEGLYAYHCSAHYPFMTAVVLVLGS